MELGWQQWLVPLLLLLGILGCGGSGFNTADGFLKLLENGCIGAVTSSLLGGNFAEMLFVGKVEVSDEVGVGLVNNWLEVPFVNGSPSNAPVFSNTGKDGGDGSFVSGWVESVCCDLADVDDRIQTQVLLSRVSMQRLMTCFHKSSMGVSGANCKQPNFFGCCTVANVE